MTGVTGCWGRVEPDAIQYDLQKIFARSKNVNLVTDTVTSLDKENKVVRTKHGEFSYDYLVLGMGGEANDFGVPGVKEWIYIMVNGRRSENA